MKAFSSCVLAYVMNWQNLFTQYVFNSEQSNKIPFLVKLSGSQS